MEGERHGQLAGATWSGTLVPQAETCHVSSRVPLAAWWGVEPRNPVSVGYLARAHASAAADLCESLRASADRPSQMSSGRRTCGRQRAWQGRGRGKGRGRGRGRRWMWAEAAEATTVAVLVVAARFNSVLCAKLMRSSGTQRY